MSVVVAIKDKDKVWMATDSQGTVLGTKITLKSKNCLKIWRPSGHSEMLMGLVGAMRDNNILSTVDYWINETTELKGNYGFKSVVRDTVPKIYNQLREFGQLKLQDDGSEIMNSSLIVAYKNKAFQIYTDGCVIEVDDDGDMLATGSGFRQSLGAYESVRYTDSLTIREKLIKSVAAACESDMYVQYPIILSDTSSDTFEIFDGEKLYDFNTGEEIDMDGNTVFELTEEEEEAITAIYNSLISKKYGEEDVELTDEEVNSLMKEAVNQYYEEMEDAE